MKKIISFIILFCAVTVYCSAQDEAGIFYNDSTIPHSRVTGQRLGNLAGAYFTGGLSGAKRRLQIEGATSELVISNTKQPVFVLKFNPDFKKYNAIFADAENLNYLVLVKAKKGKNKREVQTGSYGLTGVESSLSDKIVVPLNIEENEDSIFTISPKEQLKPGEYVFWFTKQIPDGESIEGQKQKTKPYSTVFDFSIKK